MPAKRKEHNMSIVQDIGSAYLSFLTDQEIRRIMAAQTAQREATTSRTAFNEKLLSLYKTQFEEFKTQFGANKATVPEAFKTAVDLYQPGGQYGAGAKAEIDKQAQGAIAAGQIGLTQTGMGSGTNVAGLRARIASDATLARLKAEDERIQLLGGSLTNLGQAGLTAQQLSSQERAQLMTTLSNLQPRFAA